MSALGTLPFSLVKKETMKRKKKEKKNVLSVIYGESKKERKKLTFPSSQKEQGWLYYGTRNKTLKVKKP